MRTRARCCPPVPMRLSSCGDPAGFRLRLMACRARRRTAPPARRPGTARPPARCHPLAGPVPPACRPRRRAIPHRPPAPLLLDGTWRPMCGNPPSRLARGARSACGFPALRPSRAGNRRTSPHFGQKPSHIGRRAPRGIAGYRTSGTTCQGGSLAVAHRRPRAKEPHEVPQAASFVPKTQATASYHQGGD